jgi:hypothetical protein
MKSLILILFVFNAVNVNAQSGRGKYKYTDDELSHKSKTYSAGEYHFSLGFQLNWDFANQMANQSNKVNLVFCREKDDTLNSYLFRDEKVFENVTTLGIMLAKNYNLILTCKPIFNTSDNKAEVSIFYEQDGILYNYPNKDAKNSISGKTYTLVEYKDGTNNYLQKITFENGSYLILKEDFSLYALKLAGIDCEFKIDD